MQDLDLDLPEGSSAGFIQGCPPVIDGLSFEIHVQESAEGGTANHLHSDLDMSEDGLVTVHANPFSPDVFEPAVCAPGDTHTVACPDGRMEEQVCTDSLFFEPVDVCEPTDPGFSDAGNSHEGLGDPCQMDEQHSPVHGSSAMCGQNTNACTATFPASPEGFCSAVGCDQDLHICPDTWGCFSTFLPGGLCVPPELRDSLGLPPVGRQDDGENDDDDSDARPGDDGHGDGGLPGGGGPGSGAEPDDDNGGTSLGGVMGCAVDPQICPEAQTCFTAFSPEGECVPNDVLRSLGLGPVGQDGDHDDDNADDNDHGGEGPEAAQHVYPPCS